MHSRSEICLAIHRTTFDWAPAHGTAWHNTHLVHKHVLNSAPVCPHVPWHFLARVHSAGILGASRGARLAVGLAVSVTGRLPRKAVALHHALKALADGGAC